MGSFVKETTIKWQYPPGVRPKTLRIAAVTECFASRVGAQKSATVLAQIAVSDASAVYTVIRLPLRGSFV